MELLAFVEGFLDFRSTAIDGVFYPSLVLCSDWLLRNNVHSTKTTPAKDRTPIITFLIKNDICYPSQSG